MIALLIEVLAYAHLEISAGWASWSASAEPKRCLAEIRRYPTIAALINSEKDQQPTANPTPLKTLAR